MKKLILMAVFSIVGLTAFAQDNGQEQQTQQPEAQVAPAQDDFTEISSDKLPQAVTDAISKAYPTASVGKAYKNKNEQYRVELTLEDGTTGSLFFDKDGKSIDM